MVTRVIRNYERQEKEESSQVVAKPHMRESEIRVEGNHQLNRQNPICGYRVFCVVLPSFML